MATLRNIYYFLTWPFGWPLRWVDAAWKRAVVRAANRMREGG